MTKRVLVLHDLSVGSRRTNRDHVYCFAKYAKGNLYVFHAANAPISEALKNYPFDGVIMNYCFLGYRASSLYETQKQRYAFIKNMECKKVAVCQDDYTNNDHLDEWLYEMGVDVIYSPIQDHLDVLYPRNWASNKEFRLGLTAYNDAAQVTEFAKYAKPFENRTIDAGNQSTHAARICWLIRTAKRNTGREIS